MSPPILLLLCSLLALVSFYPSQGYSDNHVCNLPDHGTTLKVMHIYGKCSPFKPSSKSLSWEETVFDMARKDEYRLRYLSSLVARRSDVPIASARQIIQSATYIVRVNIGTPGQTMLMAMDTSNDAAWVPCNGCAGCSSKLFDSTKSTSYKTLGCKSAECKQVRNPTCGGSVCTFNQTYGGSSFSANLTQDTVQLARDLIPNYSFGCLGNVTGSSVPPQGLLGLGRGPLSLLSQSQNLYKSTFSYCLPSFKSPNFSGSLRLGPVAQPKKMKYTPLLKNPRRSSLYYVNLLAIRVGSKVVDIPPNALAFNPATGAGTIFDSGTVYTRLVTPAYEAVRNEFRRRIKAKVSSLGGFDTCYTEPIVAPTITFQFSGMNVTLPVDNILLHSTAGSTTCLAMAAAPDNVNSGLNVIANLQQQNHRVLFDLPNSRLGVSRETCT